MVCKEKITLAIKSADNVATTLNNIVKGDKIFVNFSDRGETVTIEAVKDIPFGFKVALKDIQKGE
ncbi:MAG: hypothetical protein QXL89_04770 [Nitrososphaeria archaeon]